MLLIIKGLTNVPSKMISRSRDQSFIPSIVLWNVCEGNLGANTAHHEWLITKYIQHKYKLWTILTKLRLGFRFLYYSIEFKVSIMAGQERTVSHSVQHSFWSRVVVGLSFYLRNDLSFGLSFLYFFLKIIYS